MCFQVLSTSKWIYNLSRQWMACHGVDCEVSSQQVILQHSSKTHLWFARIRVVLLTAKGSNLNDVMGVMETHSSKTLSNKDNSMRMRRRDDAFDFIRRSISCKVFVVRLLAMEKYIAYCPPHNIELFVLSVKCFRQRVDHIVHDEQYVPISIVLM